MSNSIGNTVDIAAVTVGTNVSASEADLMLAYSTREGDEAGKKKLAEALKISMSDGTTPDLKGLQLIAEQRYQHSSRIYNMFSSLLDKMDQMKQRLIQKFGQG
jgi:hypothetical protein